MATYTPNIYSALAPLAGNASFYVGTASDGLWENHDGIYTGFTPPIACFAHPVTATNVTDQVLARWRVRGNVDKQPVRAWIRASNAAGTPTMRMLVGDQFSGANSVTADALYNLDVTPSNGSGVQDCVLYGTAGVGVTLTMKGGHVQLVPGAPSGLMPCGYTADDEQPDTAGWPINVEYLDRLLRAPLLLARERPVCVASHHADPSGGTKSLVGWIGGNSTAVDIAGYGLLPRVDEAPRRYIVDAYVEQTAAGACAAELRIGAWKWSIPSIGGWSSTEVVLPPGPLPIVAAVTATAGVFGRFTALQVWRA